MLAIITQAMANHCTKLRNSLSKIIAATAAAAGSRLIKMLKTRGGMRRRAISSKLYGMTELSSPIASPRINTIGSSSLLPASTIAGGANATAPTMLAIARPLIPGACRSARSTGCKRPRQVLREERTQLRQL